MRVAAISSEKGDFAHWRLDSIEINQYEKYDGFADTQAVKVVPTSKARATSQPHTHTEYGHRMMIAIMDAAFACFHTNMDELIHAHTPRETVSDLGCEF